MSVRYLLMGEWEGEGRVEREAGEGREGRGRRTFRRLGSWRRRLGRPFWGVGGWGLGFGRWWGLRGSCGLSEVCDRVESKDG